MNNFSMHHDDHGNKLITYGNGRFEIKPKHGSPFHVGTLNHDGSFVCNIANENILNGGLIVYKSILMINEARTFIAIMSDSQIWSCDKSVALENARHSSGEGFLSKSILDRKFWSLTTDKPMEALLPLWIPCANGFFYVITDDIASSYDGRINYNIPILNQEWCDSVFDFIKKSFDQDTVNRFLGGDYESADVKKVMSITRKAFTQELLVKKVFIDGMPNHDGLLAL